VLQSDVVSQHVSDRASNNLWLVTVGVLRQSDRIGGTDGIRDSHSHLARFERFASVLVIRKVSFFRHTFAAVVSRHLRQQMCRVRTDFVQFPRRILHQIQQRLLQVDVIDYRLIAVRPRLHVNHTHSSVQSFEVTVDRVDDLESIVDHFGSTGVRSRVKLANLIGREIKKKVHHQSRACFDR
jgi:hypothetical protein